MHDQPRRFSGITLYDVLTIGSLLGAVGAFLIDRETSGGVLALGGVSFALLGIGRRLDFLLELGRKRLVLEEAHEASQFEVVSRLEVIVQALENVDLQPQASTGSDSASEIREAIREGRWDEVLERVESLRLGGDLSPEFEAEVHRHRESAETDLRARMDASRQANDAESVLQYRAQLLPLLAEEIRKPLDTELIRWCMALLMKRMRAGTVRADVAQLAESIAETFPATSEGASLRASLPTLRRSAGLCARCAQPYAGEQDACPRCLGTASPSPESEENLDDEDLAPVERNEEDDFFLPRTE